MKNFVLIGAAGYVAPRHLRAIRDTGNRVLAALDKNDSVGIIDSFFPEASFFTEFERFDRHVDKLVRKTDVDVNYVSVCSPNYLHDAHIRFGLRIGADVICEKPLVLNPWNVRALQEMETETGRKVYTILQLRLHPALQELKRKVDASPDQKMFDVDLTYITSRGNWYYTSWKGDKEKSGGIATNIGIHFFDMLSWIFGDIRENVVHIHTHDRAAGYLEMDKARVRWFLSINADTLPEPVKAAGGRTFRSITVDGQDVEFSEGFTDLHTLSYQAILDGKGFGLDMAANAVQAAYEIRNKRPIGLDGDFHPLAAKPLSSHPFELDEYSDAVKVH
jgi:UDP-N-acetyl-2-amino-2-deoxyglucuronate dehydrogenase